MNQEHNVIPLPIHKDSYNKDRKKLLKMFHENLYIAGGNVKWFSHCGKSLVVPKRLNRITIQPSNSIPIYLPEIHTKNLYINVQNVHRSTIIITKWFKQTQASNNMCMDKQNVVYNGL